LAPGCWGLSTRTARAAKVPNPPAGRAAHIHYGVFGESPRTRRTFPPPSGHPLPPHQRLPRNRLRQAGVLRPAMGDRTGRRRKPLERYFERDYPLKEGRGITNERTARTAPCNPGTPDCTVMAIAKKNRMWHTKK
jgi:hypothetical protein